MWLTEEGAVNLRMIAKAGPSKFLQVAAELGSCDRSTPRQPMLCCAVAAVLGQHAVAHNESALAALHASNPFFIRKKPHPAIVDERIFEAEQARKSGGKSGGSSDAGCAAHEIGLTWTARVGASVYSTPLITLEPTGGRPIVYTNTFVRYVEALQGVDGHPPHANWPHAFGGSSFHTSPLRFDVNADGTDDLILVSYQGDLLFLEHTGVPLRRRGLRLPKLRVQKARLIPHTASICPATTPRILPMLHPLIFPVSVPH